MPANSDLHGNGIWVTLQPEKLFTVNKIRTRDVACPDASSLANYVCTRLHQYESTHQFACTPCNTDLLVVFRLPTSDHSDRVAPAGALRSSHRAHSEGGAQSRAA